MSETEATVFVVDDDAPMRESLKNLIRSVGLRVELFASAQEFLRSKRPDLPSCLAFLQATLPTIEALYRLDERAERVYAKEAQELEEREAREARRKAFAPRPNKWAAMAKVRFGQEPESK